MAIPKLHFLCIFRKKTDAAGRVHYIGELGNSRLLIYPDGDNLKLYLGNPVDAAPGWMKGKNGSK